MERRGAAARGGPVRTRGVPREGSRCRGARGAGAGPGRGSGPSFLSLPYSPPASHPRGHWALPLPVPGRAGCRPLGPGPGGAQGGPGGTRGSGTGGNRLLYSGGGHPGVLPVLPCQLTVPPVPPPGHPRSPSRGHTTPASLISIDTVHGPGRGAGGPRGGSRVGPGQWRRPRSIHRTPPGQYPGPLCPPPLGDRHPGEGPRGFHPEYGQGSQWAGRGAGGEYSSPPGYGGFTPRYGP